MNEFDLRKYLYSNPLMEKKEDSKKGNKEEQKRMEGAIRDDRDHIKDLKKDIEDNEKKLAKLKKDFKKDVNESEESIDEKKMSNPDMRKKDDKGVKGGKEERKTLDDEPRYDKKLTKEGLKDMIREKITSILNEEEELMEQEDVDVEDDVDVDVRDKEDVDVDVEKDVEVDDVSKETDIDVKTSLPGESEDVDAVLGLLTKASEEADRFSDDPELKTQIGNTITYFTRKHIASPTNEGEEVNELFGFGKKKRARSGGSDSKGFSMFAYGKDGGKRNIGSGKTAKEARRAGDFQNYRRRYAVDKFEVVNNDTGEVVDTMRG